MADESKGVQNLLVSTKEAAKVTGLSEYELRIGWKQGRYPALVIGTGGKRPRLRWRLDLLEASIQKLLSTDKQTNASTVPQEAWRSWR